MGGRIGGGVKEVIGLVTDRKLEESQKNLDRRRAEYHQIVSRGAEGDDEEPIQGFPLLHQFQQSQHPFQQENYAQLTDRMPEGDGISQLLLQQQQNSRTRRPQQPRGGGEIVEVQGGHIVRSTGRKDRHSKVCTAKGPRDRRVRLSAHTAIQFYDVQDRLGYDRPSKAVDWLMKNAKAAIDELAELPPWHPTNTTNDTRAFPQDDLESPGASTGKRQMEVDDADVSVAFAFGAGSSNASFLPPSLDSDAIANTIKSFFPVAAATARSHSNSPQLGYQNYSPDVLSRGNSQDLRLSLHSFQDAVHRQQHHENPADSAHNSLFGDAAPLAFDPGWAEQSQRMIPWNVAETGGGAGYMLNVPQPAMPPHLMLGHGQYFTQRGPLQSSNPPSAHAWADPADQPMHQSFHQPFPSNTGFASGGVFSGFRIPARIQGEEEQDGSDKPSSASSASHH